MGEERKEVGINEVERKEEEDKEKTKIEDKNKDKRKGKKRRESRENMFEKYGLEACKLYKMKERRSEKSRGS